MAQATLIDVWSKAMSPPRLDRRRFLASAGACGLLVSAPAALGQDARDDQVAMLSQIAREGLERLGPAIAHTNVVGVVDFGRPSWEPRLHLIDMLSGQPTSLLVAHGAGSDPDFSGWLETFSNEVGSQASSEGAYRTLGYYEGVHGHSLKIAGLDPTNCNALKRAVVIHSADYVSPEVVRDAGKLGWSEGCFAVDRRDRNQVMARLSPGHLLIATRLARGAPAPDVLANALELGSPG
jgi:hypothetical protein